MQCFLPQNQTTPERSLSNPWYGKGFCEPGQYRAAIDRCEGGLRSCEIGIDVYQDLIKIFEDFSKSIRNWSTTNQKRIGTSKESNTTRKTWIDTVHAVEKIADRHDDIKENLQKNVVDKLISYKNENYDKHLIHVKKIKDFEKEFKKVQKPWLESLDKLNDAKQAYQVNKRKLQTAQNAARVTESDVSSSEEQKQKDKSSVETRQKETAKSKTKYENAFEEADKRKESYQEQMFKILEKTDDFERKRLNHFKTMFNAVQVATSIDKDERHAQMATAFKEAIDKHDVEADIKFFNKNYGKDTKSKWPEREDFD